MWEKDIIKRNGQEQVYNMQPYEKDQHDCPRIVGPMTNFNFKKMIPIHQFIQLILGNSKSWLRMYDTESENKRLEDMKTHLETFKNNSDQNM